MTPTYKTPPTTSKVIVPEYVTEIKDSEYGKSFSVKILDKDGDDLWFRVNNLDLYDEFAEGEETACEVYKTNFGNWKIKYATKVGNDPRTNYTPPAGEAPLSSAGADIRTGNQQGANGKNKSIEKQVILKEVFPYAIAIGIGPEEIDVFVSAHVDSLYNLIFNDALILDSKVKEFAKELDATIEPDEDLGKNEPDGNPEPQGGLNATYDPVDDDSDDDIPF